MKILFEGALADAGGAHPLEQTWMALGEQLAQPAHEEVRLNRMGNTPAAPIDLRFGWRGGIALVQRDPEALGVQRKRRAQAGDPGSDHDDVAATGRISSSLAHAVREPRTRRPGRSPVS